MLWLLLLLLIVVAAAAGAVVGEEEKERACNVGGEGCRGNRLGLLNGRGCNINKQDVEVSKGRQPANWSDFPNLFLFAIGPEDIPIEYKQAWLSDEVDRRERMQDPVDHTQATRAIKCQVIEDCGRILGRFIKPSPGDGTVYARLERCSQKRCSPTASWVWALVWRAEEHAGSRIDL
ncbi:uncharacterized protein LY79DRAFT_581015 [Colletotrichum navitas]|uniref:Uncharacterized protein n=1 Tax=Colletotrichum navitas TaxID=681940 RepID=A0AAD8PWZ5_9PEZI|nr:uncharacterized protein LY79DRAFT_581015 [Colletotrichum navitas]KAK1585601.1 hypothetical protein LY79DRAFT_581015 [Colletotrichum navitas]